MSFLINYESNDRACSTASPPARLSARSLARLFSCSFLEACSFIASSPLSCLIHATHINTPLATTIAEAAASASRSAQSTARHMGKCLSKSARPPTAGFQPVDTPLVDPRTNTNAAAVAAAAAAAVASKSGAARVAAQSNAHRGNSPHRHGSVGVASPSMSQVSQASLGLFLSIYR